MAFFQILEYAVGQQGRLAGTVCPSTRRGAGDRAARAAPAGRRWCAREPAVIRQIDIGSRNGKGERRAGTSAAAASAEGSTQGKDVCATVRAGLFGSPQRGPRGQHSSGGRARKLGPHAVAHP